MRPPGRRIRDLTVVAEAGDAISRRASISNAAIQTPTPLVAYAYTPDRLLASFSDAAPNTTGFAYDDFEPAVDNDLAEFKWR